jgi:hypothetical protein
MLLSLRYFKVTTLELLHNISAFQTSELLNWGCCRSHHPLATGVRRLVAALGASKHDRDDDCCVNKHTLLA